MAYRGNSQAFGGGQVKTPAATEVTTSAQDKRNFTGKLLDSLNTHACRLIDRAVGNDPRKLLDLLAVTSFAAGASLALVLVEVLQ